MIYISEILNIIINIYNCTCDFEK